MDFEKASKLGSIVSKEYAGGFFRLLAAYRDISASEAASRLGIHIKTAQDFLEAMHEFGLVSREEVAEKKRPYFRYALTGSHLKIDLDLGEMYEPAGLQHLLSWKIREKKNSGAMFKTFGKSDNISSVHFFVGKGRSRDEKKLNLNSRQGVFLFHLPFPTEQPMAIEEIMAKSKVDEKCLPEILDLVNVLTEHGIIDKTG